MSIVLAGFLVETDSNVLNSMIFESSLSLGYLSVENRGDKAYSLISNLIRDNITPKVPRIAPKTTLNPPRIESKAIEHSVRIVGYIAVPCFSSLLYQVDSGEDSHIVGIG